MTLVKILIPSDIDECLLDIHECDVNATCNNTIGDYGCQCNTGFRDDSKLIEAYLVALCVVLIVSCTHVSLGPVV